MAAPWHSPLIHVNGMQIDARGDSDGVTFGKTVDGVYASDLLLTPNQARTFGLYLIEAADRAIAMGAQS